MALKRKPSWARSATAVENARRVLPALTRQFFQAGRKLVKTRMTLEQMHPFRLEAKRFRYTLEIFRPLYGQRLENRLASLRQIQEYLGVINDCATTRALLRETRARKSRQTDSLVAFLDAEAARNTGEFRKFWQGAFDRAGEEQAWVDYLSRYAGRRRRR
jgi:CHAD domain-containing protein